MENITDFSTWLFDEIEKRGWSQGYLAKKSGITPSHISRLISGTRGVGNDTCIALARAFNYSEEFVLEKAGKLTPKPKKMKPSLREALHLFDQLDPEEQRLILTMMRGTIQQRKRGQEPITHPAN